MKSIKSDSEKNFEGSALQFAESLFRIAFARVGNAQDAEDIVQETYLKAYKNINTFRRETSIKNWLNQILINTIRDHFRRAGRTVETTEWDESIENDERLTQPGLEENICTSDVHQEVMKALAALPEQLQVPLLLREIDEATYEEIAQILNVPKGTVMSRLFRARSLLREKLCNPQGAPAPKGTDSKQDCE